MKTFSLFISLLTLIPYFSSDAFLHRKHGLTNQFKFNHETRGSMEVSYLCWKPPSDLAISPLYSAFDPDSKNGSYNNKDNMRNSVKNNDDNNTINGIPLLPPIGNSCATKRIQPMNLTNSNGNLNDDSQQKSTDSVPVAFVGSKKFNLQYTCKICNTRNSNEVSRLAYRSGVVIAVCKGCKAKHLIADNLGWHNHIKGFEGKTNIEEFLEANGRADDVNRVCPNVWELETNLNVETPISDRETILRAEDGDVFE